MKGTFRIASILESAQEKGIKIDIHNDPLRNCLGISSTKEAPNGSVMYGWYVIARTNHMGPDLAEELVANALLQIIDRAEKIQ